jgi:hypothetical protein
MKHLVVITFVETFLYLRHVMSTSKDALVYATLCYYTMKMYSMRTASLIVWILSRLCKYVILLIFSLSPIYNKELRSDSNNVRRGCLSPCVTAVMGFASLACRFADPRGQARSLFVAFVWRENGPIRDRIQ